MTTVKVRNEQVKKFVSGWLAKAKQFQLTETLKSKFASELKILEALIPISQNGFRGVVLTSIVGKAINPQFKPLENFYDCSPRAIFEHGIFYALQEAKIPCGKSDPLNVAKNIQKLDYDWAKGRRPESAAKAAVDYLKLLESADEERYEELLLLYFHQLHLYGQHVNSQNVVINQEAQLVPLQRAEQIASFVLDCPEGGTIPQFIVGHLINFLRENDTGISQVVGFDESVFGTNTTSKKPSDVWEIKSDNQLGALYEITVKTIDYKRLDDCVDSLGKLGIGGKAVTFICNLPQDISTLELEHNYLAYRGVGFQFIDIRQFISVGYCLLSDNQQDSLMGTLQEFVFEPNRSLKTKKYWEENYSLHAYRGTYFCCRV
jgi:hypothetical protein